MWEGCRSAPRPASVIREGMGGPRRRTSPVDDGTMMSWQSTIRPPTAHSTRAGGRSWLASLAADGGGQKGV